MILKSDGKSIDFNRGGRDWFYRHLIVLIIPKKATFGLFSAIGENDTIHIVIFL